jgi:phytoene/squalene synthetase
LFEDLVSSIEELDLPPQLFLDLLDAFALDLERTRHDQDSLLAYCRKSADPVGRLVLRVFGHDEPRLDRLSDRICTSLQIVNHLQDIREDLVERDRIYLPAEDLLRFGVTADELSRDVASPGVRAVVQRWTEISAGWLREGWELTRLVRGRLALELRAILRGVALVVGHLRRLDHDPLACHIRLSRGEKLRALGGALLSSKMPVELARAAASPS